ncbi:c-type cytochrome [Rhodoligotrophos defluvii]|uniref:c-type cytochrome n=1 Tax=Rhodoligotrophos defluvii TaxID=2561934 RepID=UPI0014857EA8|nr:cytochrome c [Rhodoligotrophos defluvii]
MLRILAIVLAVAVVIVAALYLLAPQPAGLAASDLPQNHRPDPENGRLVYFAAGCISCHAGKDGAADNTALPTGGEAFVTPVGTFYPPNLTPDAETGIGRWSAADLANALMHGVAPDGTLLMPALPYTSYRNMQLTDVVDLHAYLMRLQPVRNAVPPHDVPGLALIRPLLGWWQSLAMRGEPFRPDPARSAAWNRGAYLVRGPGHCGECHTPRNGLMIADNGRFLAGGPHPEGSGRVPSLRGLIERGEFASVEDLADALEYGEAFGYDGLSSGGMGEVQANLSQLPRQDLEAIAEYVTSLPPLSN